MVHPPTPVHPWEFLTNHAYVLMCLAADPDARMRDVAARVGITERAAQRIAAQLEAAGYLTAERVGRRNRYAVHPDRPLGHPLVADQPVRRLLDLSPPVRPSGR